MQKSLWAPSPTTSRGSSTRLSSFKGQLVYASGKSIYIRSLSDPGQCQEYTSHTQTTTVGVCSPSGYYIASGDVSGTIKIWDTTQAEHLTKSETKVFSGPIKDIAWDSESKRIIAVGQGKEKSAHAFLFDTLSSVGEVTGHSKAINSVDIRPKRPFKAITGSDDMTVNVHSGVPFKFSHSLHHHSRFVQVVRYAPSGDLFASGGSDGQIFIYPGAGESASPLCSDASNSHTGSVFGLAWNPSSTQLVTASADSTVKLWDVEKKVVISTFSLGPKPIVENQQVGLVWDGEFLVSLSLSGNLNYWDPKSSQNPIRVITGHQRGITALDRLDSSTLVSGSYDGKVLLWPKLSGIPLHLPSLAHSNQIMGFSVNGNRLASAAMDDLVKASIFGEDQSISNTHSISSQGIPKSVAAFGDYVAYISIKQELCITKNEAAILTKTLEFQPTAIAFSIEGSELAIGAIDGKIYFYSWRGDSLTQTGLVENNRGEITCLSYSPDGKYIAAADAQRAVYVYDTANKELKINQWVFHTARVNVVSWSADSLHAVSGGLDTNLEVWSVRDPMKHVSIKCAHPDAINGVVFLDNNTVASASQDGVIKTWKIEHIS